MTRRRGNRFEPPMLEPDDPGDTDKSDRVARDNQDDAFVRAMRRAIEFKEVNGVKEGVVTDSQARMVRPLYAATHLPTVSCLENV